MLLFCWDAYTTRSSAGLYFVSMNYIVHSVMYGYYFATTVNLWPRWINPVCITVMQVCLSRCPHGPVPTHSLLETHHPRITHIPGRVGQLQLLSAPPSSIAARVSDISQTADVLLPHLLPAPVHGNCRHERVMCSPARSACPSCIHALASDVCNRTPGRSQLAQMVGGMVICAASVYYKGRGRECHVQVGGCRALANLRLEKKQRLH